MNEKTKLEIDLTKVPFNPLALKDKVDWKLAKLVTDMIVQVMPPTCSIYYLARIMKLEPKIGIALFGLFYDHVFDQEGEREHLPSTGSLIADRLLRQLMDCYWLSARKFDGGYFSSDIRKYLASGDRVRLAQFLEWLYRNVMRLAFATVYWVCDDND